jgi:hypothetical protein
MKLRKSKTPLQDFWATIEIEIVPDRVRDPNKPMTEFQRKKMENAIEALKYPGLPERAYEKDPNYQPPACEKQ